MAAGLRAARKALLTVTPAASKRIQELLSKRDTPAAGLRLGVRTRGCNGLTYTLDYAEQANKFDEVVKADGVSIFVDPKAIMHVVGTKMDFVEDDIRAEFVFENPNAKGSCGCGESFNV